MIAVHCCKKSPLFPGTVLPLARRISVGRVGKATIRKVKDAFDKTADPLEMLTILRRDIACQYLVAVPLKRKDDAPAPRELILSSYLH